MDIDVLIEAEGWDGLEALARWVCPAVLRHLGQEPDAYALSILGADDDRIAALNQEFRGKPTPTNVLSWPSSEVSPPDVPPQGELGDIALALGVCSREAAEQGKSFEHHIAHLLAHGTLHLLGYDHISDEEAEQMESIETAVLATLGVPDPY